MRYDLILTKTGTQSYASKVNREWQILHLVSHSRDDEDDLGKNYQDDYRENTGKQKEAHAFENGADFYFRCQCFHYINIDAYRRRNCSQRCHHGQDYSVPDWIETKRHSQGKENRDSKDQKPQGVHNTSAYHVDQ